MDSPSELDELEAKIRLARHELTEIGLHKIRLESQVTTLESHISSLRKTLKKEQQQLTRDQNAIAKVNPQLRKSGSAFLDLS